MRKQTWHAPLASLGLLLAGIGSQAHAQLSPFGPLQSPVSPYQNINRLGASPAVNWFTIVQPEIQFNNALGALAVGQGNLAGAITGSLYGETTGHPSMFGNYSHYYPGFYMVMTRGRMGGGMGMGGGGFSMMGGGYGGMGMGGMGMGGMGMGGMGMGGMGMGGMGMGGMGMGGMGMGGMGGMGMGGMGMGGMGMGGMGMGGMGRFGR